MKKIIKRTMATILTLVMLLTAMPLSGINFSELFTPKASAKDISSYSVGDTITYGSYPQSKVTDSSTISALDGISKNWVSYGYYTGTGEFDDGNMQPSDYMKYADIVFNGNKYRAVTFSQYRPYCTGYTSSASNSVQDDNGYYTGNVYYFKYEPLKWRVLDPSEGFVMCSKAIDSQAFQNFIYHHDNETSTDYDDYYNSKACTNYASDWATSSIREWLNDDFYNTAFSDSEKLQIGTSYNENKSTYSSKYDSANTSDKIFLLSYNEVLNSNYGFSSSYSASDTARQIKPTDYAQCQGCSKSTSTSYNGNSWWRLRSPGYSFNSAYVNYGGYANNYYYYDVNYTCYGIVPAFKFNPKSTIPEYSESFYWDKAGENADNRYKAYDIKYGEPLEIPEDPTREGYTFAGWYDYKTDKLVDLTKETMNSTEGRSFYATWTPNEYKSYFYVNGKLLSTVTNVYGEPFVTPRKPEIEGYTFTGWSPKVPKTTPIGEKTFNAVFEANRYTATLKVDGEVYKEITYTYGQKSISLPSVPKKDGYTGEWESYSLGIGGVTINAVYTPCTYTATLKVDGEVYKEITYTYGQKSISLPSVPEKAGYTGEWESYSLGIGGVTINAVYTKLSADVKSVSVAGTEIFYKGKAKLSTEINASGAYTKTFTSSNSSAVMVDNEGNIYGAKRGSATITCTITDSRGNSVSDTCTVNVTYTWWQWLIKIVLFGWIWY